MITPLYFFKPSKNGIAATIGCFEIAFKSSSLINLYFDLFYFLLDPYFPYFDAYFRWERDRVSSFDVMLILRPICAFRENLRILMKKITFRRNQEKNRGQTKPRKSQRKDAKGRTIVPGSHTTVLQWPKQRTDVRVTVRPYTAVRRSGDSGFKRFRRFFNYSPLVFFPPLESRLEIIL